MTNNPLSSLYRNKTIFISLPSLGKYYPSGITLSVDGELGVMPMTARDEIALKSPDSLFNGEALINLIKSCVPDIANPAEIPACDVDPIILAIKAASNKFIEIEIECPNCNKSDEYKLDLLSILSTARKISEDNVVIIKNNVKVYVRPYSLKSQLKAKIQKYHHVKMDIALENNSNMSEEQRIEIFNKAFVETTILTTEIVSDSIIKVELENGVVVTEHNHIKEWVDNMEKETHYQIVEKIKSMGENGLINKSLVTCNHCNHQFESMTDINPVNFFI